MSSIWNTLQQKSKTELKKEKIQNELSDEIREFRQKNKEFQATNETETYIVLCFSTIADKREFVQNVLHKKDATYIDGYKFAQAIGKLPDKPSIKLPKPLNK